MWRWGCRGSSSGDESNRGSNGSAVVLSGGSAVGTGGGGTK